VMTAVFDHGCFMTTRIATVMVAVSATNKSQCQACHMASPRVPNRARSALP
jgi:hypothetical protein